MEPDTKAVTVRSWLFRRKIWPMPIDDPLDALEQQFKMEDLAVSPVTKTVFTALSRLPLPYPFDAIVPSLKEHLAADFLERIYLLLQTCVAEVHKHGKEIKRL